METCRLSITRTFLSMRDSMNKFFRYLLPAAALIASTSIGLTTYPAHAQQSEPTFRCIAKEKGLAEIKMPPPLPQEPGQQSASIAPPETHKAVCPEGQAPQPAERFLPKGLPLLKDRRDDQKSEVTPQFKIPPGITPAFLYDTAYQYLSAEGTVAYLTQHTPRIDSHGYHTLAEVSGQSADQKETVEVGWTVAPSLNGDSDPHLFVFHWVNGDPTCYNGCGWVQVSTTRYPGMRVTPTSTPQQYGMTYYQGNWWINYQNEWIGYFPGTLWGGGFTQLDLTQWFGEVAFMSMGDTGATCTDMGNGLYGSDGNSASINNIFFINGPVASPSFFQTNPSLYEIFYPGGSSFRYGGPGIC
jgi:Neprosin